jgi:hypothetical protein
MTIKKFNIQGLDQTANVKLILSTDLANISLGNVYVENLFDSNGQPFVAGGGGGGGSASMTVSSTLPVSPSLGAMWLNDNSGEMYVYTGNVWIQPTGGVGPPGATGVFVVSANVTAGNLVLTLNNANTINAGSVIGATGPVGPGGGGGASVSVSATPPIEAGEGSLWVDTDNAILSVFLGNSWINTSIPGPDGPVGSTGATGLGATGATGATGLFVTAANVANGSLLITLSNSSVLNAGTVIGATGATGPAPSLSLESANVIVAASGTVVHNFNLSTLFIHVGPVGNFTVNFTNVPTTNDIIINFTLIVFQNIIPYYPNSIQINGVAETVLWFDGTVPIPSSSKTEIYSFSLIRTNSTWRVLGSYSTYG